jgi:hypothetical protein
MGLLVCFRYISSAQTDLTQHVIRAINVTSGAVTTLAGQPGSSYPFSDGIGTVATFFYPTGVTLNGAGTMALVVRCVRCEGLAPPC